MQQPPPLSFGLRGNSKLHGTIIEGEEERTTGHCTQAD